MQYITPAGETGTKTGETPDGLNEKKYQLELPSRPGEAPRFEWFKLSELLAVDGKTGLPPQVPQGPIEEMDLMAQLQAENALQAMEIIELKGHIQGLTDSFGNVARKLDRAEATIASLQGQLDLANNEVIRLHEAGAATTQAPAAPTPSDNANNPG
jgi:hypothetical protein